MKDGGECDLLERLAGEEAFCLDEKDLQEILTPGKYTGRCAQQVDAFLETVRPLLSGATRSSEEIEI